MKSDFSQLVASKTRETSDFLYVFDGIPADTIVSTVLSSGSLSSGTAPANTGMIQCNAGQAFINHVHIKGTLLHPSIVRADPTNGLGAHARFLLVWFHHPEALPVVGGTVIPSILEVLVSTNFNSMERSNIRGPPQWTILMDKNVSLGASSHGSAIASTGSSSRVGKTVAHFNWKVPINRYMKFKRPATTGTVGESAAVNGGHYDSGEERGQVTEGLLVLYQHFSYGGAPSLDFDCTWMQRINYTA